MPLYFKYDKNNMNTYHLFYTEQEKLELFFKNGQTILPFKYKKFGLQQYLNICKELGWIKNE